MTAKTGILLVAGLVFDGASLMAIVTRPAGPKSATLAAREHTMEVLGASIAKLRPECRVLVLSNPFAQTSGYLDEKSQYERAGVRGLRKGLGRHSRVEVVLPEVRPEYFSNPQSVFIPPDSRTPLSFLVQPLSVDKLAESHPDCGVTVSLIGLPVGVEQLRVWEQPDPRCFALLLPGLRVLGPPAKAVEAFARGKLLAAVAEDALASDPLIVTRDNVADVVQRQPQALGY